MNFYKKIVIVFFILFYFRATSQVNQERSLDTLAGNIITKLRSDEREKIFLHTNKWYFIAGEDLWFKAYSINAMSHKVFHHSKTMLVDLVNDKDSVIAHFLLNNQRSKTEGQISLSPLLTEGYYWLRAYTLNMLQHHPEDICVQPIYIFNSKIKDVSDNISKPDTLIINDPKTDEPDITFFAEGGALISGTNSLVAFSAVDKNDHPINVSGYVTDSWDSVVSRFTTSMRGLGEFDFFVWKSRKYVAHIKWGNRELTYPLPLVSQYATRLSVVTQTNDYVQLLVSQGDSIYKKHKLSYVVGVSRDSLCFAAVGVDMYDFTISKDKFPEGKATFLLFDENKELISERNIFIQHNKKIIIAGNKENYGAREKVKLNIAIGDSTKIREVALFSASVTDDRLADENDLMENKINAFKNDNVQFLPGSDTGIKNYTPQQWDLVMLTQENNYDDKIIRDKNRQKSGKLSINDFDFNHIQGVAKNEKNEMAKNDVITILSKDAGIIQTDTTDKTGKFHFDIPQLSDSTHFIFQITDLKNRPVKDKIAITTVEFPNFKTPKELKKKFPLPQIKILEHFKTVQLDTVIIDKGKGWLKAVTIRGVKKKEVDYDETKRISQFSSIVTGDQIPKGAHGVTQAVMMLHGYHLKDHPLLVVDGVEIKIDSGYQSPPSEENRIMEYLNTLSPDYIDFIEFLRGPEASIYGVEGGQGVISVITRASLREDKRSVALMRYTPPGYFHAPAFSEPDYTIKEIKRSSDPDRRSTIYWNGNVFTDQSGSASINFFTADAKTTYTVTITGITSSGDILFKTYKIQRQ